MGIVAADAPFFSDNEQKAAINLYKTLLVI